MTHGRHGCTVALIMPLLAAASGAHAIEGGGSIYPNGAESYMAGALPLPGIYCLL